MREFYSVQFIIITIIVITTTFVDLQAKDFNDIKFMTLYE